MNWIANIAMRVKPHALHHFARYQHLPANSNDPAANARIRGEQTNKISSKKNGIAASESIDRELKFK